MIICTVATHSEKYFEALKESCNRNDIISF